MRPQYLLDESRERFGVRRSLRRSATRSHRSSRIAATIVIDRPVLLRPGWAKLCGASNSRPARLASLVLGYASSWWSQRIRRRRTAGPASRCWMADRCSIRLARYVGPILLAGVVRLFLSGNRSRCRPRQIVIWHTGSPKRSRSSIRVASGCVSLNSRRRWMRAPRSISAADLRDAAATPRSNRSFSRNRCSRAADPRFADGEAFGDLFAGGFPFLHRGRTPSDASRAKSWIHGGLLSDPPKLPRFTQPVPYQKGRALIEH